METASPSPAGSGSWVFVVWVIRVHTQVGSRSGGACPIVFFGGEKE